MNTAANDIPAASTRDAVQHAGEPVSGRPLRARDPAEAPALQTTTGRIVVAVVIVAFALFPLMLKSYGGYLCTLFCVTLMATYGLNLTVGYAGQMSLGQAAFFGIGAYTSTLLFLRAGISPWVGMVAGGLAAAAFGLFAGYLSFRYGLRGPYFSLVTLAFAEMLRVVAVNWKAVGSSLGLVVPNRGSAPALFLFAGKLPYYYVILAMTVADEIWVLTPVQPLSDTLQH